MTDKRVVLSTAASQDQARRIAEGLVQRRLAACVNIVPGVTSIFRWKDDRVQEEEEWLLLIKTTQGAFEGVREALRELHPYEVPECVAVPIDAGNKEYLDWIENSVDLSANPEKRDNKPDENQKK
jgi:periplasmic divalent cation tolerance protein